MKSLPAVILALALGWTLLAGTSPALADDPPGLDLVTPASLKVVYPTFRYDGERAIAIAAGTRQVRAARGAHPNIRPVIYITGKALWEVDWIAAIGTGPHPQTQDLVEVDLDGQTGRVLHVWTGLATVDYLARGGFGRFMNSPWIWAPLCLLFLAVFFDPKRPFRRLHLDLLALLAFGASNVFFARGNLYAAIPLFYPPLAYLFVRLLMAGFRPRPQREPLVPYAPMKLLVVGLVLLAAFRIGVNVANDRVIDVGYSSVVGAHRIMHHQPLYVESRFHGDTYGPLTYVAYVPFEQIFPYTGKWDHVPAAHAASITFDLLLLLGLFLLGRRLRSGRAGRRLGLALAFAWLAYPYSLWPLAMNTNDVLPAMLLVYALLALTSPAARGATLALASATKFFALPLAPLFAAGRGERRARSMVLAGATMLAVLAVAVIAYLPKGGLRTFWDSTVGFQLSRTDYLSIWAQHPSLGWLQRGIEVATASLAVAVAFRPRRRDSFQVAALGAAVLVAVEIASSYWNYFYISWWAPFALVALLGSYRTDPPRREPDEIETAALVDAPAAAGVAAPS